MKQRLLRFEFLAWTVFFAASAACWLVSSIVKISVEHYVIRRGRLVPLITTLVISKPAWMLFVSVPWLLYALSPKCREFSPKRGMIFSVTMALALVVLITVVALACILPWLPIPVGMGH
jgi:hypothetical protein